MSSACTLRWRTRSKMPRVLGYTLLRAGATRAQPPAASVQKRHARSFASTPLVTPLVRSASHGTMFDDFFRRRLTNVASSVVRSSRAAWGMCTSASMAHPPAPMARERERRASTPSRRAGRWGSTPPWEAPVWVPQPPPPPGRSPAAALSRRLRLAPMWSFPRRSSCPRRTRCPRRLTEGLRRWYG